MNFKEAAKAVTGLNQLPNSDILLELYSLYKQGSEGDVSGGRPGMVNFKGRAKFDSWKKLAGMDKEEAKSKYIELVESLVASER